MICVFLRISQIVCIVVAFATLLAGAHHCQRVNYTPKICTTYKTIDVSQWRVYNIFSRMGGQYFVMVVCLIFILVSLALIIVEFAEKFYKKFLVIIICIISGLVMLTAAMIETFYATGDLLSWTSESVDMKFYESTISWIFTAVCLFLAMIFYFIDAVVLLKRERASYTPKQQQQQQSKPA